MKLLLKNPFSVLQNFKVYSSGLNILHLLSEEFFFFLFDIIIKYQFNISFPVYVLEKEHNASFLCCCQ